MNISLPAFCLAALLISGCATHDYTVEEPDLMPRAQMEENYAIDSQWWKLYGDARLNEIVDIALERNVDLARSTISVNKALYKARQLGAELVPSFSSSGDASSRTDLSSGNADRSFSASLGLSYELDLWGRLRNAASAQSWEYQATEQDRESTRLALINSVVNTYYSMAYTKRALEISRENLRFYEKLYGIVQSKFQAGKVDGLDPAQTEQSLLSQRGSVLSLEKRLKEEEQTLRDLLDLRPDDTLDTGTTDILTVNIPSVSFDVPLSALGARPDVQAAEARIKKGFRNYEAVQASLFPSLGIGATLSAASSSSGSLFDHPALSGLLSLKLPFLDWNKVKWNVHISEEEFNDSQLAFQKTLTTALNEVALYRTSLENARKQFQTTSQKHEADLRIEAYRKARYNSGADELKDWLDALRTSNSSRLNVLEAKYNIIAATNALYQSMGGKVSPR